MGRGDWCGGRVGVEMGLGWWVALVDSLGLGMGIHWHSLEVGGVVRWMAVKGGLECVGRESMDRGVLTRLELGVSLWTQVRLSLLAQWLKRSFDSPHQHPYCEGQVNYDSRSPSTPHRVNSRHQVGITHSSPLSSLSLYALPL